MSNGKDQDLEELELELEDESGLFDEEEYEAYVTIRVNDFKEEYKE